MARVRLDETIRLANGTVTTCAALLDAGKATVEKVDDFGKNRVTQYHVTVLESGEYVQIGQKAYESRAAIGQDKASLRPIKAVLTGNAGEFAVSDTRYTGAWAGNCYVVDVPYDVMILMRECFEVFHEQATQAGGSTYAVDYNTKDVPVRSVTIPAREMHEGLPTNLVTVRLRWQCPTCGLERGPVEEVMSYDGSRRMQVHGWRNDCGHVDKYSAVRAEARTNGLNS